VPKVSVIVPVYNPGPHLEDCVGSLLRQTMPAGTLELIFVDDGSTDGSSTRLDALAAEHAHIRVEHIPNSGWPGRPRNLGLRMARGDFVYFVDNDDWLGDEAVARLHRMAVTDRADIVLGKVVAHGKRVPRQLFQRNLHGVRFDSPLLLGLLTPHKLFRRAFLERNALRFPEGRRRLEDHAFVVAAYFRARRISVLADYACYHWALRDEAVNASYNVFEPDRYYAGVRDVLDLVERHTEPGDFRDALMVHWYRGKALGRLGGQRLLRHDDERRRELFETVRELALERFAPLHERLPFRLRLRSRLLLDGHLDALAALAEYEESLGGKVALKRIRGDGRHLTIAVAGRLAPSRLRIRRSGRHLTWVPPDALREPLGDEDLDITADMYRAEGQVYVRSLRDGSEYPIPSRTTVRLARGAEPGLVRPVLRVTAWITPTTAAGGGPLPAGQWEVLAGIGVAGFYSPHRVRDPDTDEPVVLTAAPPARVVVGHEPPPPPAPEPPGRRTRLARRAPWLTAARARVAAAARG
jgi:poly(ribitol-phosphate) beta-N-acetylglucosaminyltransferase